MLKNDSPAWVVAVASERGVRVVVVNDFDQLRLRRGGKVSLPVAGSFVDPATFSKLPAGLRITKFPAELNYAQAAEVFGNVPYPDELLARVCDAAPAASCSQRILHRWAKAVWATKW